MQSKITISLWFENQAKEALAFYVSIFKESKIVSENPVVVEALLSDVRFIGINGGPQFHPNPSISFMVICQTKEEIDQLWQALSPSGQVLMPLDQYPWSDYYGWLSDKYGYNWQLYLGNLADTNNQKIVPTLMYCEEQLGKCKDAIEFYKSLFPSFIFQGIMEHPEGPNKGNVAHAQFTAENFVFMCMDGTKDHPYHFNEAVSFVINCEDQKEIDYYWNNITKEGEESMCGWCIDPFGVSWQIVPSSIGSILQSNPNAGKALLRMKKLIIQDLINA